MKFVKLLVIALCFSCALSSNLMRKVKKNPDAAKTFKLAIFGDIGQIEEYTGKKEITLDVLERDILKPKICSNERLNLVEQKCVYDNNPGKPDETNKADFCKLKPEVKPGVELTMTNFEKIKELLENEGAHQNVLLGDALYTEAKNMGKFYGSEGDKVKDIIKFLKSKSTLTALTQELESLENDTNFKKEVEEWNIETPKIEFIKEAMKKKYMKTAKDSASKIVEETTSNQCPEDLNTDPKKLEEKHNQLIERIELEYRKRHLCGWQEVDRRFTKLNKDNKLSMSYGNHAYDVSYTVEQVQMIRYSPWRTVTRLKDKEKNINGPKEVLETSRLPIYPKISYSEVNGVKVWFLDIDMTPLVCSDALEVVRDKLKENSKHKIFEDPSYFNGFKTCFENRFAHLNPGHFLLSDQMKVYKHSYTYYLALIHILGILEKAEVDWRIVRIHQSIFNIERDYLGVKSNKFLMESFKKTKIHLWLASHHHSAQINFGKYEDEDYKYLVSKDPGKRLEFNDPIVEGNKSKRVEDIEHTDKADYFFAEEKTEEGIDKGCRHTKLKYVFEGIDERKSVATINRCQYLADCKTEKIKTKTQNKDKIEEEITLHKSTITINPKNTDYIIQLVTGNGGRKLDPLLSDLESDSFLLFGRAYPEEFGYYTLELTKEDGKNVAYATFKFGPSDSKSKVNYSLKIVQDESVKKFEDEINFKKSFDLKAYLNNKYGKYIYEKDPGKNSKKDKYCLKKIPFLEYNPPSKTEATTPAASTTPPASTTTPATSQSGSVTTTNPTTAPVTSSKAPEPNPKPGKKRRKF
jgi:hypothetical protein